MQTRRLTAQWLGSLVRFILLQGCLGRREMEVEGAGGDGGDGTEGGEECEPLSGQ